MMNDLLRVLIETDELPYLVIGGTEDEWFDALESGYFATEYSRLEACCMERLDMPMIVIAPPADGRVINALFNGQIMGERRHGELHDI